MMIHICDADEIAGCQDATACNYNENATDDDSSCVYATGCSTCSGETDGTGTVVDNDSDDDVVVIAQFIESRVSRCNSFVTIIQQQQMMILRVCMQQDVTHVLERQKQRNSIDNDSDIYKSL